MNEALSDSTISTNTTQIKQEVRTLLHNPNLTLLPRTRETFGAVKGIMEFSSVLQPTERQTVYDFVTRAVSELNAQSLGGRGDEMKNVFTMLSESVPPDLLRTLDSILEAGGFPFRLPLAVVRALEQNQRPATQFPNTIMTLSGDVAHHGLCPTTETRLLDAIKYGVATVVDHHGEPIMVGKFIPGSEKEGNVWGKWAALCVRSDGPFVAGMYYTPGDMQTTDAKNLQDKLDNGDDIHPDVDSLSKSWIIDRPTWGMDTDQLEQLERSGGEFTPIVSHELAEGFTNEIARRASKDVYIPHGRRPKRINLEDLHFG